MKCAVGKCKQSTSKKRTVSFYNFPKDAAQRKLWVLFCNRCKPIDVRKEIICALHFKQEDFERNLKFEMGFSNRRAPRLKPGAVPTIDTSAIGNEIEIPNEIELPNEIANSIEVPNEVEISNEVEIKNEFQILNEVEFQSLTCDEYSPMTTDIKEDDLQLYIKTLEMEIDVLHNENSMLKKVQSQSEVKLKKLARQVQSLSCASVNLDKSLRRLFTECQLEKLKNGNKIQNFTEEDIIQSMTLYSTSAKAYKMLRKKHFPLPSVKTLQRWLQKLDMSPQ